MVAWVVINRRHPRQPRKSRSLPLLFLFNVPTCKPSNISNVWFSVSSSKFRIPQLLCLPLLRKLPGVYQQFPFWNASAPSEAEGRSSLAAILKFFLFTPLRTLLLFFAPSKNSTYLFSNASALFAKNHPGWGWGHESPLTSIGFPSPHPIKSPHRPHHERKRTRQDEATS
jgi:hypothetical protein